MIAGCARHAGAYAEHREVKPVGQNETVTRSSRFLACLLCAVMLAAWTGCASRGSKAQQTQKSVPQAVTVELQRSVAGWNEGNVEVFVGVYAEDATFARPENFVRGRAAIRDLYAPIFMPNISRDALMLEQVEVTPLGKDIVLVKSIYRNMRNGKVTRRGTTTLVMRMAEGKWRIVHDHSS